MDSVPDHAGDGAQADRDGSSPERAIRVRSIAEEYRWIQDNLPTHRLACQGLLQHAGRMYDLLTLRSEMGDEREVYFDISDFYGKGGGGTRERSEGAPCPYCGAPLRTEKAKQCLKCGMDWHDPANVYRRGQA
jgi:hypothetical protein